MSDKNTQIDQDKEDILKQSKIEVINNKLKPLTMEELDRTLDVLGMVDEDIQEMFSQPSSPAFDTMSYIKEYKQADQNFGYGGYHTPESVNRAMQRTTLVPLKPTQSGVDKALENPYNVNNIIISYGDYYELNNMIYKRMIQYYGNLLSFDLKFYCTNATEEDYSNNQYLSDEKKLKEFLFSFDYRKEFAQVTRQLLRQDAMYCFLRNDKNYNRRTLQELPRDYCITDARWPYGLLFSFDMEWFYDSTGVDLDMYPKSIQDAFKKLHKGELDKYDPSAKPSKRDGEYIYEVQMSPADGAWVFKFNEELVSNIPLFSPMFREFAYKNMAEQLQNNAFLIKANQIIMGIIGTQDNNRGGNRKDDMKLTPKLAAEFSVVVRHQLNQGVNFAAVPFDDVKQFSSELDKSNILDEYQTNTVKTAGGLTSTFYKTGNINSTEAKHHINIDEIMMQSLYEGFAGFIEYFVNQLTVKYKFKIVFEGSKLREDRKFRKDMADKDWDKGIIDLQTQSASRGMNWFELESSMQHGKSKDIGKFIQLFGTNSTTSSDGKDGAGANEKSDIEISDAGEQTRSVDGNVDK